MQLTVLTGSVPRPAAIHTHVTFPTQLPVSKFPQLSNPQTRCHLKPFFCPVLIKMAANQS
uniref:Uncharacterized protein n=1 Tax=Anguilla anguilla TaxID=7936 RepID=A0A0E9RKB6_ANGAN